MNRSARLGLLIATAAILFLVTLFTIGDRTFLFSDTMIVQTRFNHVAGLQEGAPVQFQGINVGRVQDVELPIAPGEPIRVTMSISVKAKHLIRKNTQAQIKSDGLVGEQIIVLVNPAEIADPLEEDELLPGVDPFDLFEITDRAMGSVLTFENAAIAFEQIMRDVQRGEGTLGKVIYDSTLYVKLVSTTNESRRVLNGLANSAEASAQILVGLAEDAAKGIESILAKADSGNGTLARFLNDPALFDAFLATSDTLLVIAGDMRQITQSAENAAFWGELGAFRMAELMEAAKHNWLFKRYFEERGSIEAAPFEVREAAVSESFKQISSRERELLLWEARLKAFEEDLNARRDSSRVNQ
jgi:phospholipid/cholesterol/gamma-HCH transport system substrate-binding protein